MDVWLNLLDTRTDCYHLAILSFWFKNLYITQKQININLQNVLFTELKEQAIMWIYWNDSVEKY